MRVSSIFLRAEFALIELRGDRALLIADSDWSQQTGKKIIDNNGCETCYKGQRDPLRPTLTSLDVLW